MDRFDSVSPLESSTSEAAEPGTYTLSELAAATGVPVRTIRYYLHRGLLPSPPFRGPRTVYSEHHRNLLRLIEHLHERGLSLEAIAQLVEPLEPEAVVQALAGELALVYPKEGSSLPRPSAAALPPVQEDGETEAWELAPGLFLLLSGKAPPESRSFARNLLQQQRNRSLPAPHGGGTVAMERNGEKD